MPDLSKHELTLLAGHPVCPLDTDGDGNCPKHPRRCPVEPSMWRLAIPEDRNCCVTLVFGPDGIALYGDINFGRYNHLAYCVPGRGIGWFRGAGGGAYLASKFMGVTWDSKRAAKRVAEMLADLKKLPEDERSDDHNDRIDVVETILADLQEDNISQEESYNDLHDAGFVDELEDFGLGYDEEAVASLSAVQKRFDECYTAMFEKKA